MKYLLLIVMVIGVLIAFALLGRQGSKINQTVTNNYDLSTKLHKSGGLV